MPQTNLISLAGLVADRTALTESQATDFVTAELGWRQDVYDPHVIAPPVARKIIDAALTEHPTVAPEPATSKPPAPVSVSDVAALVSPMFNVPIKSAELAVYRELEGMQARRSALISPSNVAARDVLQVLANLLRATRTRATAGLSTP